MNLPTLPQDYKAQSFWARKEGTTGMIMLALLGVGGFFIAKEILPTILSVLDMGIAAIGKAITLTVLGVILFLLFHIVTNRKVHVLVASLFKSAMRKITQVFIEIDPIGIMKNYIDTLRGKQKDMDGAIEKLKGQTAVCKQRIQKNENIYDTSMGMAAEAKKREMAAAVTVNSRQAMRMERLNNETLKPMLTTMEVHLRALRKYREVTESVILDLTNEVDAREQEREMILASYSAMKAAKAILNGDQDQRELFDQAMEFVQKDYGMKMGEIENFMEMSKGFVDGLDLQNGVYEAEAYKRLQEWETKADSILLGDNKRLMLEQATMSSPVAAQVGREPVTINGEYEKFLTK